MTVMVKIEVMRAYGLTDEDAKARWTNNKITAHIARVVEDGLIGQVVRIDAMEVNNS